MSETFERLSYIQNILLEYRSNKAFDSGGQVCYQSLDALYLLCF
jgi:hypothetical protein